jgi:hypothetical protein
MSERSGISIAASFRPGKPDEGLPDHARQTEPEDGQRKTGRHLIGHQCQCQETEQQREQHAGDQSTKGTEPRRTRQLRDGKGRDRAHDHHALDTQIENAGAFDNQFADGRQQQRSGRRHDRQDDCLGHIHQAALPFCADPKTSRMR